MARRRANRQPAPFSRGLPREHPERRGRKRRQAATHSNSPHRLSRTTARWTLARPRRGKRGRRPSRPKPLHSCALHRQHQRELLMANRDRYHDHGLVRQGMVRRKAARRRARPAASDEQSWTARGRETHQGRQSEAEQIRRPPPHVRHAAAAGGTARSRRQRTLGHSKVSMTMEVSMRTSSRTSSRTAAAKLGTLLHG